MFLSWLLVAHPVQPFIHIHPNICGEFFADSGEAEGRREKKGERKMYSFCLKNIFWMS